MPTPTVARLGYRRRVKVIDAACRLAEGLRLPVGRMDADEILAAAKRSTGLADWGDDDFLVPLRRVVQASAEMTDLTPLARVVLRQSFIKAVENRLTRTAWLAAHPEVRNTGIDRPIFVLGFPRTGTTLLQNLLAQHPGRRGLRFWELTSPVPVHEDRWIDRERRRRATKWIIEAAYQIAPEMSAVHYIDTDTYEECWPLFGTSFAVMNWDLQSGLRSYGDFLMQDWDMTGPYREYELFLKVLLERWPADQLVLKCPEHLWFIDALLDVFPDACIVWTHRDPFDTVASYCSLMSLQWRTLYGHIDRPKIGGYMQDRLHGGVTRAMEAHQRADPDRFFMVRFPDLVANPTAVVGQISDHFGFDVPDEMARGCRAWLDNKRADARGKHKYDASMYGLERDVLHNRFSDYIDTFGLELGR